MPDSTTIPQAVLNRDSVRPFRLWNAHERTQLRWRYYAGKHNAHIAALIETRWADVGVTIEVFDIRNGKLLGQYTRRLNTVAFNGNGNSHG